MCYSASFTDISSNERNSPPFEFDVEIRMVSRRTSILEHFSFDTGANYFTIVC